MRQYQLEPGSFRDRDGRVFYSAGRVFRALSQSALADWEALAATRFFDTFTTQGNLVATRRAELPEEIRSRAGEDWAAFLEHAPIAFISYPYEWSFGMLRDAALLQTELVIAALEESMILKDSTPYNVQWNGARPVFIDIPSFERYREGTAWVGYKQFCSLFLYPLFFQAYKNIPFQPWLRGSLDGVDAEHCASIMSLRDLFRSGVFTHTYLHAKAQRRYSSAAEETSTRLGRLGFSRQMIQHNVRGVDRLVRRLSWQPEVSEWSDYAQQTSYTEGDRDLKVAFVRAAVSSRRWSLVWDLGCNTGTFSRIAADNAEYVVAFDADHLSVERFYDELKSDGSQSILPLVLNLADPPPNLGWRGEERRSLVARGKPDLVLCLALIHHLVITANIPLNEFVDWLAELGASLVIEFVTKADPMVQKLLQNKEDIYADYEQANFERCLSEHFLVVEQRELSSGTRTLYFAHRRDDR